MSNVYDTGLLIQLLDGGLPEAEREQLLQRIQDEPALQSEWSAISMSKELLRQYGEKKNIGLIHREMMAELGADAGGEVSTMPEKKVYNMFPGRKVKINMLRAVAAVLLLVLSATLYPYFSSTPAKLFAGQFETYHAGDLRGGGAGVLENDYRNGNLEKVIAGYKAGRSGGPSDDFLAGTVYLQLQQPLGATAAFQQALNANRRAGTHILESETTYYLALAWLAAGEPKKALPLFTAIRADRDNPYHDSISWWFMLKLRRLASR